MATDVTVRRARADDAEAVAALRRTVFPYKVMSAEMLRHAITSEHPGEERLALVAERTGRIVGWGKAGLNVWTSASGHSSLAVFVHPDHRGDGIGSTLCTRLHQHLRDAGAQRVQVFALQDSGEFARHRGYEPARTMHYAGVRLEDLPPGPTPPAGVELHTYAEVDPRSVYAAEMLAASDEPGDAPLDSMDYDQWLTDFWNDPAIDRNLSVAAVSGDEVLSFTIAETDGDRLWSAFSGTVPPQRGRGLSKLVKSASLHRAHANGVVSAYTSNDDRNGPMLAVNDWLGYRRVATELGLARDL